MTANVALVDLENRSFIGTTQLSQAISRNDKEIAISYIERGANVNLANSFGYTPLHFATNCIVLTQILLSKGANPDAVTRHAEKPLHRALAGSATAVVDLLLTVTKDIHKPTADKETILHQAVSKNSPELIIKLLSLGAPIDAKDGNDKTPIMHAAEKASEVVVKLLIENGANLSLRDNQDKTAARLARDLGKDSIAQILEEASRLYRMV